MNPAYVVSLIMAGLGFVAWVALMWWSKGWQDELAEAKETIKKHQDLHNEHNVRFAVLTTELGSIKETVDETHKDVKQLLQNGNRTAG